MRKFWLIFLAYFFWIPSLEAIELEDIFTKAIYYPSLVAAKPYPPNDAYFTYLDAYSDIVKCAYADSTDKEIIFSISSDVNDKVNFIWQYQISENGRYVLFSTNFKMRYRHSSFCQYYLYDKEKKEIQPINNEEPILNAIISPDNKFIAFLYENNIYLKSLGDNKEYAITTDGEKNKIINGSVDWVYEEEFEIINGMEWSPHGNYLSYYKSNVEGVNSYFLKKYDDIYPDVKEYKYPKTDQENSIVSICVYSITDKKTKELTKTNNDYLPRMLWSPWKDTLVYVRLNRAQNNYELHLCNVNTKADKLIYSEKNSTYVRIPENKFCLFLKNENSLVIKSEKSGFMKLYLVKTSNGAERLIDNGEHDVNELYAFNEIKKEVYYTSYENSSVDNGLYAINITNGNKRALNSVNGWVTAIFNRNSDWYSYNYSSVDKPPIVGISSINKEVSWILEDNDNVVKQVEQTNYQPKKLSTFESGNGSLNYYLVQPKKMKKKEKYPLLIFVYGGPESQQVVNMWNGYRDEWFQYLAEKGYVVACVDGRGTGGKGKGFIDAVHEKIGMLETQDQLDFAKFMGSQSFIDKDRIGIFGWSFGGYLTLLCMQEGNKLYKTGISVAPITDWKFYDSAFTERYMKLSSENEKGYNTSSALTNVASFKKSFLLVHGLYDDNVHFQHSAELIKEMIKYNKPYDLLIFPYDNHNINSGNSLLYLYTQMSNYIFENL